MDEIASLRWEGPIRIPQDLPTDTQAFSDLNLCAVYLWVRKYFDKSELTTMVLYVGKCEEFAKRLQAHCVTLLGGAYQQFADQGAMFSDAGWDTVFQHFQLGQLDSTLRNSRAELCRSEFYFARCPKIDLSPIETKLIKHLKGLTSERPAIIVVNDPAIQRLPRRKEKDWPLPEHGHALLSSFRLLHTE